MDIVPTLFTLLRMHNPPHPGEVLRDGVFAGTGITVTEFARRVGVTGVALSRVPNGKAAISAETQFDWVQR
jgi:addiction module HigA family antidote